MIPKNAEVAVKKQGRLNIHYRKGSMDEFIIKEIFGLDEYFLDKMMLPEKAVIIDVGAQIGCFTMKAAAIARKGRIFSFEPMESNFRLLKRNVESNGLSNAHPFHKAVAGKGGKRKLYMCTDNTGGHSISAKRSKKYEVVDCVSLRQVISENKIGNIDLMKLDCEGAEYEILYGTPKPVFGRIARLIIEFHDFKGAKNDFDKLYWFLRKRGFIMQRFKRYSDIHGMALFTKTMEQGLTHKAPAAG